MKSGPRSPAMKRLLFIAALLLAASVREGSGQFVDQAVIWFPSGVAVVGLLLLGAREAWTVALFTFVHRLLIGYDAGVAVSAAAGSTAEAFVELFHDEGDTDQLSLFRTYRELGFDIPLRCDHVPAMEGEGNETGFVPGYGTLGRLFADGYLNALLEASDR